MKKETIETPAQNLMRNAFLGKELTKEDTLGIIKKDLRMAYMTLVEVVTSEECMNALNEIYYKRYQDLRLRELEKANAGIIPQKDTE